MTEQDRGAYAPQNEAPLAFDPRRAGARRGPAPLTLIVSAIVLVALVVGVVLLYRHGARQPGQAPQVVGAPVGDTKSPPPSSQAESDANAGLQVYKSEVPPPSEAPPPSFAPPPEQPQPRPVARPPAPPPVAVAQLRAAEPAPTVAPPAAKVTPAKVTPPTAKVTPPTAKVTPAPAASSAPPKVVKTPKVVVATPTPVAAPAAGGVMAQVGSESSAALADRAWSDVAHKVPGLMAGKSRKVETFSKDGKTFYRALVGGFASHADAVKFCTALKAAGGGCIVR